MGAGTPWWYRGPTRPLGIIVTCAVAIAIIVSTPDIATGGIIVAIIAGGCAGLLTQFVQGAAQARYSERSRQG
ncbi:hypothetical protein [Streptomyces sp. TRM68367]|uniref:hypothetical protein n=1 Tax=Streptomyces sp. TRM68367 TaxID=2758415 RepID=UPI00165A2AE4|nr:hypothetical protein [Streptomyces sp. TRM68367]MBC9724958.1 hypothetical protein [Streptomyces sp. TRM68367]